MPAMRALISWASAAALLIALAVIGKDVYSSPAPAPTTAQLRQVVVAHYRAIEANRLDKAMSYYHSQSPEFIQAREDIVFGLSRFLLKTTTMSFCSTGQRGDTVIATAKHKYLLITGLKFIEHVVDTEYQLRQQQGNWKIWTRREGATQTAC